MVILFLAILNTCVLFAQNKDRKHSPRWIWFPEGIPQVNAPNAPVFFRKSFSIPHNLFASGVSISVDNEYALYLNGKPIGKGAQWSTVDSYNILPLLFPGKNCLAVKAQNQGGPAGLLCSIAFLTKTGETMNVSSDDSWLCSQKEETGWMNPDFNDKSWIHSLIVGTPPDPPWGKMPGDFGSVISLDVTPDAISPNNDGFNDSLEILLNNFSGAELDVQIDIMDRRNKTLASMKGRSDKNQLFSWDGVNDKGEQAPQGVYICAARISRDKISLEFKEEFQVKNQRFLKKAPNIMKDVFPIGVWFDGRVEGINCSKGFHNAPLDKNEAKKYYEENFTDIKNHNIDLIVIPNTPPDYREILLSAADKTGVKIVLEIVEFAYVDFGGKFSARNPQMEKDETLLYDYCKKIIEPLKSHPSLFCYQILDEPSAELFPNFHRINRILEDIDPARPSFSCLCREDELHRTSRMGTQMMVFDRYPLRHGMKPGEYDFRNFISLLENLKKRAVDIPYWMVAQTCAMDREGGLRYPTPEELRLMVYLSLAHNAKGIFYFLHNSYTQEEKLLGLVDIHLKPHPLYKEAADIAAELKKLSPLLLTLKPVENIVSFEGNFDAQTFKNPEGESFIFISNLDVIKSAEFKGMIKGSSSKRHESLQNFLTGEKVMLDKENEGSMFRLGLKLGEGAILRVMEK
ncbi:gliding motility-associated C-terminal domain-containing protein [Candidatus Sumerlaeota bacterium]|nr:gliding motility-associated C-terminal domain-containing protein [Candidatus Sumerlaeota bacterium]